MIQPLKRIDFSDGNSYLSPQVCLLSDSFQKESGETEVSCFRNLWPTKLICGVDFTPMLTSMYFSGRQSHFKGPMDGGEASIYVFHILFPYQF